MNLRKYIVIMIKQSKKKRRVWCLPARHVPGAVPPTTLKTTRLVSSGQLLCKVGSTFLHVKVHFNIHKNTFFNIFRNSRKKLFLKQLKRDQKFQRVSKDQLHK